MAQIHTLKNKNEIIYPVTSTKAVFNEDGYNIEEIIDEKIDLSKYAEKSEVVLKEEGKGLSTNDFSDVYKTKLDNIESGADDKLRLFVDLWNSAAEPYGLYDPDNAPEPEKPFMLNGLWFSYSEAVDIYNQSVKSIVNGMDSPYQSCRLSTVLPLRISSHFLESLKYAFRSSSLRRVSIIGPNYDTAIGITSAADFFIDCASLEEVVCYTHTLVLYNTSSTTFRNCRALREMRLRCTADFDIHWSPLLSLETVRSFIPPGMATKAIVITVHQDVYAKLTGDTTNDAAAALTPDELAAWQQVLADAADKNITFITV